MEDQRLECLFSDCVNQLSVMKPALTVQKHQPIPYGYPQLNDSH